MSKELRGALYRARASMAEVTNLCSAFTTDGTNKGEHRIGFQQIDRAMQNAVEDADEALINYEKTHIFHLWVCPSCGTYQLPEYSSQNGEEGIPECSCGKLFGDPVSGDPGTEMQKVHVERMD